MMDGLSHVFAQGFNGTGSPQLDSWIAIGRDGSVTAYTGKCELGQGLYTAQMQLVAEELGVPLNRVRLDAVRHVDDTRSGHDVGQQSHPDQLQPREPGARRRDGARSAGRLAADAARRPAADLVASDGRVAVKADPSRSVAYGELVGGQRFNLQLDPAAKRKHPSEWTVLGTAVPRVDMRAMVTGRFEFVHNVRVPGMLHGRVVRPPAVGATLVSVDESSVRELARRREGRRQSNFVGVVAEKPWQAMQAPSAQGDVDARHCRCRRTPTSLRALRKQPARDTLLVDSGDVDATLTAAATVLKATYLHPYQMHGSIGSSCAVADVQGDKATIWSATQAAYPDAQHDGDAARPPAGERARDLHVEASGCYGINGADTVSYDAALLSQAVGRPVRVQLSRKDEMAWENYGIAFVIDQRVGARCAAAPSSRGTTRRGRRRSAAGPATTRPATSSPGSLAGFEPAPFAPRTPAPAPNMPLNNGINTAPSYVAGCVGDAAQRHGRRSQRARALAPRPVAVLHRTAALAGAAAEHVRARMVHGRSRGARRRPIRWRTACGTCATRGSATSCARRRRPRTGRRVRRRGRRAARTGTVTRPRHRLRLLRRRQRLRRDGGRGRRRSGHRPHSRHATRRRAGLRADLEPRRHAQPDRRRRAAGHEPRARRRGDLGRSEGDVGRLAHATSRCRSASRVPAIESVLINQPDVEAWAPARPRSPWSRRDRQRDLRRHRRATPGGAVHARTRPCGASCKFGLVFALLALASAACYGAADFLGGLTSKRASTLAIVVVSQLAGLLLLLVAFPFLPAASPDKMDFVWGAVAGLTGGTGVALLYRALAIGVMAVVAPTTAVCAVVIPVLVAIGLGERPGVVTIGGIVLAIIAIALVSQSEHPRTGACTRSEPVRARRHLPSRFCLASRSGSSSSRSHAPRPRPECGRLSPRGPSR